jgi:urease accessory protein
MKDESRSLSARPLLRLQSWLSPTLPIGSYSYSHGLEAAIESGYVTDLDTLISWLDADLRYGSIRNEAILFCEAWRAAEDDDRLKLGEVSEWAAAYRGTAEFLLESSQQATACLALLRRVWPDPILDALSQILEERKIAPALAVVLGVRSAKEGIALELALPAYVQSIHSNLVTAAVRLIPLGQTAGQGAIAGLEDAVLALSARAPHESLDELGSAAFALDLVSMAHETQYTRLFRS